MILKIYSLIVGFLAGRGLGRFQFITALNQYFSRILIPKKDISFFINGKDRIFMHGSPFTGIQGALLAHGGFEKYETSLFKRFVKQGMNVVDAGANIGYYTLLAAKLVGDEGKVFAFEPEPENYSLLLKNININGYKNVIVLQKAASNKTEKKRLILSEEDPSGHSFCNLNKEKGSIMVDAVSLDDFFEKQKFPIDVIKMDIEGAEMLALLGMEKIIETNDNLKIFTEFYPELLRRSGFSPKEYWAKLTEYGFEYIYFINEQKQRLEPIDFVRAIKLCEKSKLYPLIRKPLAINLFCAKSSFKG